MIVFAALMGIATGCASTQGAQGGTAAQAARGAREEEYEFSGHKLKVKIDENEKLAGAQASKDGKDIPTFIVPAREVTACLPQPGGGQHCEPFLYMPEKTFFKIGTGTICSMWYQNHWIYYQC
jgi:hypothetical protein